MPDPSNGDGDLERVARAADEAWRAGAMPAASLLRVQVLRLLLATRDDIDGLLELVETPAAQAMQQLQDWTIETLIEPDVWPLEPLVDDVIEAEAELVARLCRGSA